MGVFQQLTKSARYQKAKQEFLQCIVESAQSLSGVRPAPDEQSSAAQEYRELIETFADLRGRDLFLPTLTTGFGRGPYVELRDGSIKLDMIAGMGIYFFGHAHRQLIEAELEGSYGDIMQGNLAPGPEMFELAQALLSSVGDQSRLQHAWFACSGSMANENALKIIRQAKAPGWKVIAFEDCFSGRSAAMQEITDNPSLRVGQPLHGIVSHLPFYDSKKSLETNINESKAKLEDVVAKEPNAYCALMLELVQGEGGIRSAPAEYYRELFLTARSLGLVVWLDEVQTFGRLGELFGYQYFGLDEWVDIVTIGKLLPVGVTLFTSQLNPNPGLIGGTFSGSTVGLKTGTRMLQILKEQGFLGKDGKISRLSNYFERKLRELEKKGLLKEVRVTGGMVGFQVFDGSLTKLKHFLNALFRNGVIGYYCGHGPYLVRFLPPLGCMSEKEVDEACVIVGQTIEQLSKE